MGLAVFSILCGTFGQFVFSFFLDYNWFIKTIVFIALSGFIFYVSVWTPCFHPDFVSVGNPYACTGSDVGSAMRRAGIEFSREPIRTDSFWAVLVLMGGPANAGPLSNLPSVCPSATWFSAPLCRDSDVPTITRHYSVGGVYPSNFDADDWARENADYVANPVTGQGATIFSICLGEYCRSYPYGLADSAENLAEYMALTAGNESGVDVNHGNYYYAPDSSGLSQIFLDIAANILTRLSQ